jgi:hypothetical protein
LQVYTETSTSNIAGCAMTAPIAVTIRAKLDFAERTRSKNTNE